ncbi:MAG: alpha/beta fold hydrolase [Candidatus Peregrinibacteria bacterium]|nr:alpha/beta fold hydrolase [Candidatus Peregrinibacteria bacterium]
MHEGEHPALGEMPDGVEYGTITRDSYAEAVSKLYDSTPTRVDGVPYPQLKEGAQMIHNDMSFSVGDIAGAGRVVFFSPKNRKALNGFLLQQSGYMQLPTSMLTDKILEALLPIMESRGIVGVAYAHGGRGSPDLITHQGRWGVKTLQAHIAKQVASILRVLHHEFAHHNENMSEPPVVLMGHSQGGQIVAHELSEPQKYGFSDGQIRGAALINSVALPHSQAMLRTPGFVMDIARRTLPDVIQSFWSGDGLLLRDNDAFRAFLGEGDPQSSSSHRMTTSTLPAETAWFVQTLTSGTSPKLNPAVVRGMPISLVTSVDDQLMGAYAQKMTHNHVVKSGANTLWQEVPGRHFSPIMLTGDESIDRVLEIIRGNTAAFTHSFQNM